MKILAASDIHGSRRALELIKKFVASQKPDLTIVCGDITHFGTPDEARWTLDEIPGTVLAIPGNCDPPGIEDGVQLSHGVNLHGNTYTHGKITFAGFGGAKRLFGTVREYEEGFLGESVRRVLPGADVLVLHGPPYGINDLSPKGNAGSREILTAIREYKPLLVLSGHIHECFGVVREGATTFINPGASRDGRIAVLEVDEEERCLVEGSVRMIRE